MDNQEHIKFPLLKSELIFFSICLILGGVALIGFFNRWWPIEWQDEVFSLPVMLFLLGTYLCFCRGYFITGLILLLLGGYLPFLSFSEFHCEPFERNWPVVFVFLGVLMLLKNCRKKKVQIEENQSVAYSKANALKQGPQGFLNYKFLFSEGEQIYLEPYFRGGKISIYMGGLNLDLRHTYLPSGETHLYIKSYLGNVILWVPENWQVEIRSKSLFGKFVDKRISKNYGADNKLIIDMKSIYSGGEIR